MKPARIVPLFLLLAVLAAPLLAQTSAPRAAPLRTEQGNLIFDGIPAAAVDEANHKTSDLSPWLESRSASFVDWLADGSLIISTRFGNTAQLHRLRAPSGMREQITWHDEPVTSAVAHPYDADTLLLRVDRGGDENTQIWLHNLKTGAQRLLTDGKSRNGPPVFARDGKRVAFASNARDGTSHDIFVTDITGNTAPQLLIGGDRNALDVQDWSLDDERLLLIRRNSITDSPLLVADVATGMLTRVEPAADYKGAPVAVKQARFSRDGRGVFYLSDHGGEFAELYYADLYTGEHRVLTPQSRWDVERFDLSNDGRYVAYTLNEGGIDRLVLYDLLLKADVLLPPLPVDSVISALGFDHRGNQLAVAVETAQSPRDVHVYTLGAPTGENVGTPTLARWTHSEIGPIDATRLVAAERIEFPTWDQVGKRQRLLPAFVFRPHGPGPHPVIISIQNGPDSQYRPGWNAFTQYLVNELGYAVVAPNVRGAAGYGRSYLQLDDGELRDDAVRDIGALLVWIGTQRDFNRSHIVLMGGYSGGYLTLASLANYGDRLAGAVDVAGIGAAQANAAAITRPLLLVRGLNDPRVSGSDSQVVMASVRASGGELWYLAAKDEGHGFRKQTNRDVYLTTVAQFLRHLDR